MSLYDSICGECRRPFEQLVEETCESMKVERAAADAQMQDLVLVTARQARAEIVAKLRARAKRTAAVAGENWAIDTGPLEAAAEFDLAAADWIEAGCPT